SMAQLETIGCWMLDVGCWMFSFGSRIFRGILSMTPWEHRTSNIQHPTGNQWPNWKPLVVGCWMLDVFLRFKIFSFNSFPVPWQHRTSNIQHPTPNRQSMAQLETIGCWMEKRQRRGPARLRSIG